MWSMDVLELLTSGSSTLRFPFLAEEVLLAGVAPVLAVAKAAYERKGPGTSMGERRREGCRVGEEMWQGVVQEVETDGLATALCTK